MSFVIGCVPVIPMRGEAAHRSEMVSQLLLGETGEILHETKDFIKIKAVHDGYEGWCQRSQLAITDALPASTGLYLYTREWTETVLINDVPAQVPMGCPVLAAPGNSIQAGPYRLQYTTGNSWQATAAAPTPEGIRERAGKCLNTPYLWGGRSVFGIDCSGFTQLVFRYFNIALLRDAYLQATQGEAIGFLQEARCGDLAFFDNDEGRITHVGILLNDQQIIHAAGKVRIDNIDNAGIINTNTHERTHRLRLIKRYW